MTGSDTHADTIREALDALGEHCPPLMNEATTDPTHPMARREFALAALDALVAEIERERARADRAEAALAEVVKRSRSYYASSAARARVMGEITEIANAALSAGSGGRETTP